VAIPSGPLGAPNASLKSGRDQEIGTDEAGWIGDEAMSSERGWIGDPQPSVEWRDSHYSRQADRIYSRQADRINTQPDPLRGEGGHDAELAEPDRDGANMQLRGQIAW
ncbi:MAG TPA: hypothetical protein VI217_22730, partial [Mycobacterium sp.]